jgi:hypothetical protein
MCGRQVAGCSAQCIAHCTAQAGSGEDGAVAGLSAAGKRALLSGVVPGPRGIVAGQPGVVSSFLVGWSSYAILMHSLLKKSIE